MIKARKTSITLIPFFIWISILSIFTLPQTGKCKNIQDTMWGVEILRKIDETANLASEEIKVGNMQGIDSSIQYITHIWQTYVDQEQTIFDGEMVKNDSLGILINIVCS